MCSCHYFTINCYHWVRISVLIFHSFNWLCVHLIHYLHLLFIYNLYKDLASSSYFIASNYRVINDSVPRRMWEKSVVAWLEIFTRYLLTGSERNHKIPQWVGMVSWPSSGASELLRISGVLPPLSYTAFRRSSQSQTQLAFRKCTVKYGDENRQASVLQPWVELLLWDGQEM